MPADPAAPDTTASAAADRGVEPAGAAAPAAAAGAPAAADGHPVDLDATTVLPVRIGTDDPAPVRDLGDGPRTDLIPRVTASAADLAQAESIRAALARQSAVRGDAALVAGSAAVATSAAAASGGTGGGPRPPSDGTLRVHGGGRPRRWRGLLYAGRTVAALVALLTLLGVGLEWKIKDRADVALQQSAVPALIPADTHISTARTTQRVITNSKGVTTTEAAQPKTTYRPENILLLGSDTRAGGNAAIGGSDQETDGVANSDTLMVAHISGDRQHVTVLSIPRDTIITTPACRAWTLSTGKFVEATATVHGGTYSHINSLFAVGGPQCTVAGVQALTGLGITRVIGIDFTGFKAMVDALGGVTVNVCRPIVDRELGTVVPTGGTQLIHGEEAINLVRARNVIGDSLSDLARIHRQQLVLSAILRQVTQAGTLLNPAKLDNFLQAFTKNTFTDNVTIEDLVNLAGSLGTLDPAHVTFYTLPTVPSVRFDGALDVDTGKAALIFDDLINDLPLPGEVPSTTKPAPTPVTPSPTAAPSLKLTLSPAQVSLELYNVSGTANLATMAQQRLNAIGFKISDDQLFKPAATGTGTTVQYAPANRAAALTVAAAVPGSTLLVTPGLGNTVRLLLGPSFTGSVRAVFIGESAPSSLATAIRTGPSVAPTTSSAASTALSSVNAGASACV